MDDGRMWSTMAILTWGAWAFVAGMVTAMWVALTLDWDTAAVALGLTAGVASAVAATMHIRRFTTRTQELLIRLHDDTSTREQEVFEMGRDSVRPIRPPR